MKANSSMQPVILKYQTAVSPDGALRYIITHHGKVYGIAEGKFVHNPTDLVHCKLGPVTVEDLPALIAYGLVSDADYKQLSDVGCLPEHVSKLYGAMKQLKEVVCASR